MLTINIFAFVIRRVPGELKKNACPPESCHRGTGIFCHRGSGELSGISPAVLNMIFYMESAGWWFVSY